MTLPKLIELQWQIEVIESWLNAQAIPSEAREGLLAMQRDMKEQMEKLKQIAHCL